MGRRRTQLELSDEEYRTARRLVRSCPDPRLAERAAFALLAAGGGHTLEELAPLVGRQRSTLQNWLLKFQAGGLEGLLDRRSSPGVASPVAKPNVQRQLQAGLKVGRWATASEVAAWLKQAHGIQRARKSIYYWLNKQSSQPG